MIDLDARQITDANGADVMLTTGEFDLLACFIQRARRVLSRDQLLDHLRGRGAEAYDRTIDMMVSRLRRKLSAAGSNAGLITTVRNSGYLFTPTVEHVP